jgi:hypothetical protein
MQEKMAKNFHFKGLSETGFAVFSQSVENPSQYRVKLDEIDYSPAEAWRSISER